MPAAAPSAAQIPITRTGWTPSTCVLRAGCMVSGTITAAPTAAATEVTSRVPAPDPLGRWRRAAMPPTTAAVIANQATQANWAVQWSRKVISRARVSTTMPRPYASPSWLAPANAYGETKRMVEQMLEWYGRIHGLRWAALRYFNAAGALTGPARGEAHQPESHLIPRVLGVPLGQAEAVPLFGADYPTPDGTCIRDYIHIADLVSAHLLVLDALAPETGHTALAYNLGNGAGYSNRQVVETARAITGHAIPIEELPRRLGDAPRLVAASDKIKRELGWQPQFPDLADIVASAWEWHRTHPHGYEYAGGG